MLRPTQVCTPSFGSDSVIERLSANGNHARHALRSKIMIYVSREISTFRRCVCAHSRLHSRHASRGPTPSAARARYAFGIQGCRQASEGVRAARLHPRENGRECLGVLRCDSRSTCSRARGVLCSPCAPPKATQPRASLLGCSEGGFCPCRDHPPFFLGHHRHDSDRQPACIGHVDGDEVDPGALQAEQKDGIAAEAVEFGDDELGAVRAAEADRASKLDAIISLARFDLDDFFDKPPITAVQIVGNRPTLRLQAEPRAALPIRGDAKVADESTIHCGLSLCATSDAYSDMLISAEVERSVRSSAAV